MSEMEKGFANYALVDIMGHKKVAGYVTEEVIFGKAMVRIDVPEIPPAPAERWYSARPGLPGFTQYYGPESIYCITPTTEEAVTRLASELRVEPIANYDPHRAIPAPVGEAIETRFDDDDEEEEPFGDL